MLTKTKGQSGILTALLLAFAMSFQAVNAVSFLPQDPRSLAMGGASVATGNSSQAHYYNPSLLNNASADEDFNWEVDAVARVSDSDNLFESMNDFGEQGLLENYVIRLTEFTNSISVFDFANALTGISNITIARDNLVTATSNLQTGIRNVTGKSIGIDANIGTHISIPNLQKVSGAFYYNVWTSGSIQGVFAAEDDALISGINTQLEALPLTVPTSLDAAMTQINQLQDSLTFVSDQNLNNNLQSSIGAGIAVFREFGLSLARNYTIQGHDIDIGLTPKYITVDTSDLVIQLNELTDDNNTVFEQRATKQYTSFNADIGISKQIDDHWKTGLVIKNIIPQSFDTPSGRSTAELSPAARIGAGYRNKWASVALDFDLTENTSVTGLSKTRFLALGAEVDLWILKLRAGYRANLASSGGSIPSIGVGLYLFGLNIDAAIAANQFSVPTSTEEATTFNDISYALRAGIQW